MALTIKVRAQGDTLVPNYEHLGANPRRFVGRKFDPSVGAWVVDGVAEIPDTHEYRAAIAEGALVLVEEAV
jgi:hypothetical protein